MADSNKLERKPCQSFRLIEELDQLIKVKGMSRAQLNNPVITYTELNLI